MTLQAVRPMLLTCILNKGISGELSSETALRGTRNVMTDCDKSMKTPIPKILHLQTPYLQILLRTIIINFHLRYKV
jgi:hypothetical protein